jgi:hypothetical protein
VVDGRPDGVRLHGAKANRFIRALSWIPNFVAEWLMSVGLLLLHCR